MNLHHEAPDNQNHNPASALLPSYPTIDHLSLALHGLSQGANLTHLTLCGDCVISGDLFWPESQRTRPSWPNMLEFNVQFNMTTPDGGWYFIRSDNQHVYEEEDETAPYAWNSEHEKVRRTQMVAMNLTFWKRRYCAI